MELAAKAAAVGVCAALMALLLKKSNAELALCLGLAAGAAILAATLLLAEDILGAAERARELSGLSPALFTPVVKCVGIGIVCALGSEACKDAGSGQLASAVPGETGWAQLRFAQPLAAALLDTVQRIVCRRWRSAY